MLNLILQDIHQLPARQQVKELEAFLDSHPLESFQVGVSMGGVQAYTVVRTPELTHLYGNVPHQNVIDLIHEYEQQKRGGFHSLQDGNRTLIVGKDHLCNDRVVKDGRKYNFRLTILPVRIIRTHQKRFLVPEDYGEFCDSTTRNHQGRLFGIHENSTSKIASFTTAQSGSAVELKRSSTRFNPIYCMQLYNQKNGYEGELDLDNQEAYFSEMITSLSLLEID